MDKTAKTVYSLSNGVSCCVVVSSRSTAVPQVSRSRGLPVRLPDVRRRAEELTRSHALQRRFSTTTNNSVFISFLLAA